MWLYGAKRGSNSWSHETNNDLTGLNRDNDIVKVGYPNIKANESISGILDSDFYKVIWERKEVKEISKKEAIEILKKHYGCDVKIKE